MKKATVVAIAAAVLAAGAIGYMVLGRNLGAGGRGASTGSVDKVELRLRLKKGDSYTMLLTADQKMKMKMQGQEMGIDQAFHFTSTYDVEEVAADGTAAVRVTYDAVMVRQKAGMLDIEYNSEAPSAEVPPMAQAFAALVGQSFNMDITRTGTVKEVRGADALLERMLGAMNLPEGPMRQSMENSLAEQFSSEGLKEAIEKLMGFYPEEPVGVGDSWSTEDVLTKGFPIVLKQSYTVKDRKDGMCVIGFESTMMPNRDAEPLKMGMMSITYALSGEEKGTMEVDESSGWIRTSKATFEMSGEMKSKGPGVPPEGMAIPMSVEGVTTTRTVDKK